MMNSTTSSASTCSLANSIEIPESILWTGPEKLVILVILPVITVFGDAGNLAFLFTAIRLPRMHTAANLYLATVAILDIMYITGVCILYLCAYSLSPDVRSNWQQTSVQCWLTYLLNFSCYFMPIILITLLSLERYYAICHPLKHRLLTGKSRIIKQMVISALLAVVIGAINTIKWGDFSIIKLCVKKMNKDNVFEPHLLIIHTCQLRKGRKLVSLVSEATAIILFLLAMISSSVMYGKVLRALSQRSQSNLQSNIPSQEKVRKQVAQMLIANGMIFFICQIPYRLYSIHEILADTLQVWSLSQHHRATLVIVGRVFTYLNSAVNPYIYVTGSTFYRAAFMEAFGLSSNVRNGDVQGNTVSTTSNSIKISTIK